jgi:hypothetical protein
MSRSIAYDTDINTHARLLGAVTPPVQRRRVVALLLARAQRVRPGLDQEQVGRTELDVELGLVDNNNAEVQPWHAHVVTMQMYGFIAHTALFQYRIVNESNGKYVLRSEQGWWRRPQILLHEPAR